MAETPKSTAQTVEVPVEAPAVDTALVVRTIVYLIAVINAIAAYFGFDLNLPAKEEALYQVVSVVFAVGSFAHAYFKHNNITKSARIKAVVAKQVVKKQN